MVLSSHSETLLYPLYARTTEAWIGVVGLNGVNVITVNFLANVKRFASSSIAIVNTKISYSLTFLHSDSLIISMFYC